MEEENQFEIDELILKYLRNELNADEKGVLDEWIQRSPENYHLFQELTDDGALRSELTVFQSIDKEAGRKKLYHKMGRTSRIRPTNSWLRYAAAASILLVLSTGAYFLFVNKKQKQIAKTETQYKDVEAPKGSKATITLANGQNVLLDSIANGTLATQGNVKVIKNIDGQILYNEASGSSPLGEPGVGLNTLTNPRGSNVVDMTLADGSHVWLNAASSITYPVVFIGNERKVSITGEAYFTVRHNPKMPFKIMVNGTELQDLGTEFNVNGYADEAFVKTTLVEGSIRVVNGDNAKLLMPGQQAQISSDGKISLNKDVDIEEVVAWKNGRFQFSNTDIKEIMQQISRWYDVDVVFESSLKDREFTGKISREVNVSRVLAMLEYAGLQFKIEGKKVTVIK